MTREPHRFFYDEDCGICTWLAQLLRRYARASIELVPMQTVAPGAGTEPEVLGALDEESFWASAHYIRPDGREFHGGASVTRALRLLPGGFLFAVLDAPGVRRLRDGAYVIVARNRHHISRLVGMDRCRL